MKFVLGLLLAAAPPDDAIGIWRFNAPLSTYQSAPAPRQSTRVFERSGEGVRFLHTGVGANGEPFRTEFVANYDGKDYPVSGNSRYDTVSLQPIDRATVDQTFRLRGEVTVRARRTISEGRRRMTIVAEGTNPDGTRFQNVLVYDRVE